MKPITREMLVADLSPAPYNPREISEPALAGLRASIERWGLVEPIVWNERTRRVVGGHQRLKVLAATEELSTLVVVVDLPEDEEKALNITLNNPEIAGTWTAGVLPLLEEIRAALGEAAERLGRRCFAVERMPQFVDVAVRRWEQFTGRLAERFSHDAPEHTVATNNGEEAT